jgi:hypothetical protein
MAIKTRSPGVRPTDQIVEVMDLTGGIDVRRHPTRMREDRARKLINWSISEPGALVVRSGYLQFSTTSLGATRAQGGERVYLSSNRHFTLVAYGGEVFKPTDTGAWGSAVGSTIAPDKDVFFPYDRDFVVVMDGTNQPEKSTDGTNWTHLGIEASSTNSTVTSTGGGDFLSTGRYEIGFTYEDNALGHESNGGKIKSFTMPGSTGAIRVEVHGSTDPQVDSINVYIRNLSAGETIRRKASSMTNQTDGSTVSVVVSSTDWLSNAPEPTDHTVPPLLSYAAIFKNRWWARHATIGNRLHFTQVFQPQSWPGTFFLDIPFERGDEIKAVIPVGDTLMVFGNSGVFFIIGQTSLDFEVRPALESAEGAFGQNAVTLIENGVLHAGVSGVYVQDGASDRLLSFDIQDGWEDLVRNANVSDLGKVSAIYHTQQAEVRIAVPRLFPTAQSGEWVLDLNRTRQDQVPAWTQTDRAIGGYIYWSGAEQSIGDRGRLFSWTDTSGLLFEESTGQTANSSNLTAEYEGPSLSLGLNRARVIETWGEYEPHGGSLTDETVIDGQSQGQLSVEIGSGLSLYGTALYGTATYGGSGRRLYHLMLPLGSDGRTIVKKITYSGQEQFRMFTYSYNIVPEIRPREHSE